VRFELRPRVRRHCSTTPPLLPRRRCRRLRRNVSFTTSFSLFSPSPLATNFVLLRLFFLVVFPLVGCFPIAI